MYARPAKTETANAEAVRRVEAPESATTVGALAAAPAMPAVADVTADDGAAVVVGSATVVELTAVATAVALGIDEETVAVAWNSDVMLATKLSR